MTMKRIGIYAYAVAILGLTFAILGVAAWQLGGVGPALAWFRGEAAYMPSSVNIGELRVGVSSSIQLPIFDLGSKPLTVLGCHTGCGCLRAENLPITVRPGQQQRIQLTWTPEGSQTGEPRQVIRFYFDELSQRFGEVVLFGRFAP